MFRKPLLAAALTVLSLAPIVRAADTMATPLAGNRAIAVTSSAAGYVVVHLTHGQWVREYFSRYQDAYQQLMFYRSYGIPAHMGNA